MTDRLAYYTADDMTALDEMAVLSGGDAADFDRIRTWYEADARWRVPPVIVSYTPAGPVSVPL